MLLKCVGLFWIDLPQATKHTYVTSLCQPSNVCWAVGSWLPGRWFVRLEFQQRALQLFTVNSMTNKKKKKKHISVSKRQRAERAYSRVESKNGAKRLNWWIEIRQHAVNIYLFLHRRHIHFILNLVYPVDQSRGPCAIATVCPCVFISTCSRSRPKPNHLIKWWIEW